MGKRDELKKLKAQRIHMPIHEMETPVEDIPILDEVADEIDKDIIAKVSDEIEEAKKIKETEITKEQIEFNIKEDHEIKTQDATKQEIANLNMEFKAQSKNSNSSEPKTKETSIIEEEKVLTKRTSIALRFENNQFLRLRAMQLGLSIQHYINLLIEEEKERSDVKNIDELSVQYNLEMNYKRGEKSTIVALVLKEKNAKFLKKGGAMLGMNVTNYLNYIISEEIEREKKHGKRSGEYED